MSISLRYLTYILLIVLGACAYHGENRSDWDTLFADANACKTEACKKAAEDAHMEGRGKGGKR